MTYDLRTLADGAAAAWQDAPEFLRPILRDCADALIEAADFIDQLKTWVPHPSEMSGWNDPECDNDTAAVIREACETHGVDVPEHLIETR